MERGGGQRVTLRSRQLETKPTVIPQATHHAIPAISRAYPLGPGQASAGRVDEGRKEQNFSSKTV